MKTKDFLKRNLKEFLNFLPIAVFFVDSKGYILETNRKMESLLDSKSHELIDEKLDKVFEEKSVKKILSGEMNNEEAEIKGKEDKHLVNVFTKIDKEEDVIYIACSDLSKAKKIEEEMEEKVKELERFNRLATGRELRMVELKRDKKKIKEKFEKLKNEKEKLEREVEQLKEDNIDNDKRI
jgi:transcriptional regulator with PAS, ATPase and Fis domain